jgi:alpha-beta hydrolase superfamily lysophospholipase
MAISASNEGEGLHREVTQSIVIHGAIEAHALAAAGKYRSVRDQDEAPLFVLVHGASKEHQHAGHWIPIVSAFTAFGDIIAVDTPGHGKTPVTAKYKGRASDIEVVTSATEQWCAQNKWARQCTSPPRVVLVGRSWGAGIVIDAAAQMLDRIAGLVLIAPSLDQATTEVLLGLPAEVRERLPVLLVSAEDDPIVPHSQVVGLQEHLHGATAYFMGPILKPGMQSWKAHTPELERPREFKEAIRIFMSGVAASMSVYDPRHSMNEL